MKKKLIILVLFVFLLSLGVTFRSNVKSVILNSNNNLYKDANTGKKLYEIIKSLSKGTDVSNSIN